jgi:hypothetical protein
MDFRLPKEGNQGGIRFLFDCGALSDTALARIVLQPEEISEHRLVPVGQALTLLRAPIRRRVSAVRRRDGKPRTRALVYLEDGRAAPGILA